MSAVNIAVETNPGDWTRWYDDEAVESRSVVNELVNAQGYKTRNSNILNIEEVPFVEEYTPATGDVYTLDVNTFHTWKCVGPSNRIILQTKFEGFPDFQTITESLSVKSFVGIRPNTF